MASQVGGDLAKIQSGPVHLKVNAADVGHTMEGVRFNITPDLRERTVDEYGTNVVDVIHQGDAVTVSTTLQEKTLAVVQVVYVFGYQISTTLWGVGRIPGTKGSTVAKVLLLHPLDITGTQEDVTFHKGVVSETDEVQFGVITADRVFAATWQCLIDESKADGRMIGEIGLPTA